MALAMGAVAVGSAAVVSPWWVGVPLVGVWGLLEATNLRLLRSLTAGMARGDGSAFMGNGERIDLDELIRLNARSRWQLPVVLFATAACAASILRIGLLGLLPTFLCLLPLLMLWSLQRVRTALVRINQANRLLRDAGEGEDDARLARVERLLDGVRVAGNPALEESLLAQRAQLAAQRGEVGRYRALIEELWSGGLDVPGLRLAALLNEHGDAAMTDRLVAQAEGEDTPNNPLLRYWLRRVTVHRALSTSALEDVVAQTEGLTTLPPDFAEALWLPRQAALRGLGREADPEGPTLEGLVERRGWSRAVAPRSWAVIDAVRAGGPLPPAPVESLEAARSTPPAVPVDEGSSPVAVGSSAGPSRHERGYVPVEWMPAGVHMTRRRVVVQALAALVLVPLGMLLLGLSGLLMLSGAPRNGLLSVAVPIAVLALGVPITAFARRLLMSQSSFSIERARSPGFTDRGIVGADGVGLLEDRFLIAFFANSAPGFASLLLLGGVGPMVEWSVNGTVYASIPGGVLALVIGWSAGRLAVGARVVERAHVGSPDDWLHAVQRVPSWLALNDGRAGWLGLACLWNGDRSGARDAWRSILVHRNAAEGLQAWLAAGDGTLDLAHLVTRRLPERPGPAYRFAVTVALAALSSDDSELVSRVRKRSDALRDVGRGLPNRFGDLLLALLDRLDDPALPLPADLMWFDAVWPGVWSGAGEKTDG